MFEKKDFESMLQENLELYIQDPGASHHNFFQATREISLARYALSKQAEFYAKAIEVLTDLIDSSLERYPNDPKILTDIMVAINAVENKSSALIRSVREVTELLGKAVNIDIDKAALSNMIIRLPSLVRESIEKCSANPQLAEQISSSLDSKLSELMLSLRFSPNGTPALTDASPKGITEDQYKELFDSIPTQPEMI